MKLLSLCYFLLISLLLCGCAHNGPAVTTWSNGTYEEPFYNNAGYYNPINNGYYAPFGPREGYYHYTHSFDLYAQGIYYSR